MENEKRLIDANALKLKAWPDKETGEGVVCVDDIDAAPTVDAVEVVRCKDCKWYEANCETCVLHSDDGDTYDCGYDAEMKPDDFCSNGERREGE